MTTCIGSKNRSVHSTTIAIFVVCAALTPTSAWADPLGAGGGAIYVLSPKAHYQEGCFPPCMCPIMIEQPIGGTFKLVYAGPSNTGLHSYAVEDVNWTVPFFDPQLRITGAGKYTIGSPGPITLLQQRMELDLYVGSNAVDHFDSGWVPLTDLSRIHVTVSMHGMWCYDRVITIDAARVPDSEIQRYSLAPGATYEYGCCRFSPCDCLCFGPVPMVGDFALVFLNDNSLFREYAVVDVRWQVPSTGPTNGIPIRGFGLYRVGGEFAVQHQLSLELWLGNTGPTHFDSGFVVGGWQFPVIDISVSRTAMDPTACADTILHVVAKPAVGNAICGGIAGLSCPDGFFCKLPAGECCCDFMGFCAPIPGDYPPMVWMPVCGCDGRTYGNEYEADRASVSIAHRGPCEVGACCTDLGGSPLPVPVCTETTADQCQTGIFQGPGTTCEPAEACCMPWNNNACVNISRFCCEAFGGVPQGLGSTCVNPTGGNVCGRTCGGFTGYSCEPGEFCKFPEGICSDAEDHAGICTPIPNACPAVYDPVCGCDGVTYGNECEADRAGVSIAYRGECGLAICAASRTLSDPELSYCPDEPKKIRIELTPPSAAQALGMEDSPPQGWIVTNNISHGGAYDPVNKKVKWGPLFPPFPAELTYEVIPTNTYAAVACFSGTVSVDGSGQRICGDECIAPSCCPLLEADRPQAACAGCPVDGCDGCGGGTCEDGQVTLCEVIGYACSWMRGCNDDLSGMTRAAYVWRSGECYCWDDGQQKWLTTSCPPPESGCCPTGDTGPNGVGAAADISISPIDVPSSITVLRDKSVRAWTIPVTVEPPSGTAAVALEVQIPAGWIVMTISDEGVWDDVHRKIKWGPFFDDVPRTVMFQVRPAVESGGGKTRTPRGGPRLTGISGTVSFDGLNHAITVR